MLFITRTWHGVGGMQRLSHDLWQGMHRLHPEARLCRPSHRGVFWLVPFVCRALYRGVRTSRIHLGDASLMPLGALICLFTGARVTVTVNGLDILYDAWWYRCLVRFSLPYMHRLICVSRFVERSALSLGASSKQCVVIPCGVSRDQFPMTSRQRILDCPHIVTVGRLVPRKGVYWFLEHALPLLLVEHPRLTYTIIGDGPDRTRIVSFIRRHGLQRHVLLTTDADDEQRSRVLAEAHLFLAPNIRVRGNGEGFGIACLEAGMAGLPVLAANIEGLLDSVIDGRTGRFFESGNAQDCVCIVRELLRSPLSEEDVRSATLQTFDLAQIILRYDSVWMSTE